MDLKQMMQQARKMQADLEKAQLALAAREFIIEKQGVKLIMKGDRQISRITIDAALIDPEDPELLGDLIMLAVNEGIKQIDELSAALTRQNQGGK